MFSFTWPSLLSLQLALQVPSSQVGHGVGSLVQPLARAVASRSLGVGPLVQRVALGAAPGVAPDAVASGVAPQKGQGGFEATRCSVE